MSDLSAVWHLFRTIPSSLATQRHFLHKRNRGIHLKINVKEHCGLRGIYRTGYFQHIPGGDALTLSLDLIPSRPSYLMGDLYVIYVRGRKWSRSYSKVSCLV